MADVYMQMEPLRTKRASQTPSCGELQNPEVPLGPNGRIGCRGCKCAQLDELFEQVAVLREELNRLQSIRESERKIDVWYQALAQAEQQPCLTSPYKGLVKEPPTLN